MNHRSVTLCVADEVTDPALQRLIREGTEEQLIRWLEAGL